MRAPPYWLAAVALAACTQGAIISGSALPSNAANGFVRYAAATGDFPVLVLGNPSPIPGPEFVALVLANLRLPSHLPRATFTADPDPDLPHALRLVLVFNAENLHLAGKDICESPDSIGPSAAAQPVRVKMALCNAGAVVTENAGFTLLPDVTARKFGRLLSQTMNGLLPPHEIDLDDCVFRLLCP